MEEHIKEFGSLVDALKFLQKSKTEKFSKQNKDKEAPKLYCDKEIKKNEICQNNFYFTDDIYVVNENQFYLTNRIDDVKLTQNTVINFSNFDSFGNATPGITNNQLIYLLYYRYRNDKDKIALIKQLLR